MAYKSYSRYRGSTMTSIAHNGELKNFTVLKLPIQVPETEADFYVLIDQSNEFRPDLLSYQCYGDSNYGWAILEVNNMRSFLELKTGVRLRIPPILNIEEAVKASHDRV